MSRYRGDLTISIYPDLQIRIPNHQLVVPNVERNGKGQAFIPNATQVDVLFNALLPPEQNTIAILGRPFLSSAYLSVDYDQQTFTLWPSQRGNGQDIVYTGPSQCDNYSSTSSPTSSISSNASETNSPGSIPTTPPSKSPSTATIAAAVSAGSAALALVVLAACLLRRRRQGRRLRESLQKTAGETQSMGMWKAEMAVDGHLAPQEMPTRGERPEMAVDGHLLPHEMPTRGDGKSAPCVYELPATTTPELGHHD